MDELKACISKHDLQQTIDFWNNWLDQKKSAGVGEFMLYGGRALEACKELMERRAEPENKPLTFTIEFTQEEIINFKHYLIPIKNNQSLDPHIRLTVFELLHKFPRNVYAHKPELEEK